MKKALILGSDYGTIDMAREAKKMGVYVITSDLMDTSPTKEMSDEAWQISTTDIDLLEAKCREQNVTAIMVGASDFNIHCARKLCKRLGLPIYCESDLAWKVATDKSKFKEICKQVGAPIAEDIDFSEDMSDEELAKIKFPVVVKPVDKSGNRGMSYCYNIQQLREAYRYAKSVSENSTILVERQLHGPEWTVNYIMADGEIQLFSFLREHHQPGELANLYSLMNSSAGHQKQYIEETNDKVIEVLKAAGFKEGLAWVEVMLDDDGHFYLIESGYRYGGDMIYTPYEHVCGFNSIKWMVEISLGIEHKKEDLPQPLNNTFIGTGASYYLFATKDDMIDRIIGLEEVAEIDGVTIDMPKRIGAQARYHAAMGTIRIFGKTCDELIEKMKRINAALQILNKDGEDLILHFDDYDAVKRDFELGFTQYGEQ
ncbi:MAG: ATP-grasp domain-containing protein [Eubacteriales bacterium]|nr:ATP-grasp domain-containing protein [Eubacteriales bacterium]